MKKLATLVIALLMVSGTIAQTNRVGTFDRQSIVIAYYRSPQWAATLREKQAELDAAKRANDQQKVHDLEAWGGEEQELASDQLAGTATIDSIIDALQPALVAIEKSAGVANIVPCPCSELKGPTVDVTPQLLDWLKADAKTRKIIEELPHK